MSRSKLQPILFVPDTHRPFHDKKAWRLMLKVGKQLRPHTIACIGDFADFYSVSSHSKDPNRTARLREELADVNVGLDELDALGAERKEYVGGNHESRLTRYLADKAPELFGVVDIPDLLRLKERGWNYTPYKSYTKIGKLHLTHDVGAAGRNAVFKSLDTFQHSIVTGHSHRLQYVTEGTATGEHKLSFVLGWLGDAKAVDYIHQFNVRKNWSLAFGVGYLGPKGIVYVVPVPIIVAGGTYSCVVNGQLFEG